MKRSGSKILLFSFLLISFFVSLEAYRCPGPGWVPRLGTSHCYLVKTVTYTEAKFWNEARDDCLVRGGVLAFLEDQAEVDYLAYLAEHDNAQSYWVGLSYESGNWTWSDSNISFSAAKFPSVAEHKFGGSVSQEIRKEHRGYIRSLNGNLTLKTDRQGKHSWICKADYSSRPLCKTEEGWHYLHDRCWQFQPFFHTWDHSKQVCMASGGTISVPQTLEETAWITNWSTGTLKINHVWMGLQINKSASGSVDQSAIFFENNQTLAGFNQSYFTYVNLTKQLDGLKIGVYNGYIDGSSFGKNKWSLDGSDYSMRPYVCETDKEKCPYGWDHLDDQCYRIHNSDENGRTWDDANKFCTDQGGHLAFISSQRIQDFLSAQLASDQTTENSTQSYWIGYRSTEGNNGFSWTPNNATSLADTSSGYSNWLNEQIVGSSETRCAFIDRVTEKWQSNNCREYLGVICQAHYQATIFEDIVHIDFECETPFEKYYDQCLLFVPEAKNWDAAKEHCIAHGSKLVEILTSGENTFIKNRINESNWIGVRTTTTDSATSLQYSDGTSMTAQRYQNFRGSPSTNLDTKLCYVMASYKSAFAYGNGKWESEFCTAAKPFVCSHRGAPAPPREPPFFNSAECGPGWILNGSSCYKIHIEHVMELQASQTCQNEAVDSSLLSITSPEEQSFIREMITGRLNFIEPQLDSAKSFWIAMRVTNCSHAWYWQYRNSDDQWKVPLPFSNWDENEPKTGISYFLKPDCSATAYTYIGKDDDAKWAVSLGSVRRPFICKKPAKLAALPTAPTIVFPFNITYGCPQKWHEIQGQCYQYNTDQLSWGDASLKCHLTTKAALASFYSESQLVTAGLSGHWIGLNSLKSPQNPRIYENTDGSLVTYTPWSGPQVANKTENKTEYFNCVFATGKSVQVGSCLEKRPYVCMAPLQPLEQNPSDCIKSVQDEGCRLWGHARRNKCYYMGNDPTTTFGTRPFNTFNGARALCQTHHGSDLIVINDSEEQEFLTGLFANWAQDSWIGLQEQNEEWNSWGRWINGDQVTITNWGEDEPKSLQERTGCAALHSLRTDKNLPGDWYVANCEDLKFAVCEGPREGWVTSTELTTVAPVGCPKDWTASPDPSKNCYQTFYADNEVQRKKTWREAEDFCIAVSGHLASIKSQSEQDTVWSAVVRQNITEESYKFWLGLNESPNLAAGSFRPVWKWADGTPFGTFSFFHPSENHSSPGLLDYDCVAINVETGRWIEQSCHLATGWVCEVPKGLYAEGSETNITQTAPTISTLEVNATCGRDASIPGSWYYDAKTDNCFFLSSETDTWNNAQNKCLSVFANLATIAQMEQVFVTTLLSHQFSVDSQAFIGLYRSMETGSKHQWIDGSILTYRIWEYQDPTRQKNCVTINSRNGKWSETDCGGSFNYLCLADKTKSPLTTSSEGLIFVKATEATLVVSAGLGSGSIAGIIVAVLILVPGLTYLGYFLWSRKSGPRQISMKEQSANNMDHQPVIGFSHEDSYP